MTNGNRIKQNRNRRKNNRGVPKQNNEYFTIDGNWTFQPFAYCTYHHGYMTRNLVIRHDCLKKKCVRYRTFEEQQERIKNRNKTSE